MKKYFISSIVIITFIAYSLYQRAFGIKTVPIVSPKIISNISNPATPISVLTSTPIPTSQPLPTKQLPSPSIIPTSTPTPTPPPNSPYKDGSYTGDAADAFYGNIQVKATISNGRINNVEFLQYPNDRGTSIYINSQADPILAQEAIQAQSANVDIVSGATDSSNAFVQSLQSALDKAKN